MEFYGLPSSHNIRPVDEYWGVYQTYTAVHQVSLTKPQWFPLTKGEDLSLKTCVHSNCHSLYLAQALQLEIPRSSLPSTLMLLLVPEHTPISNNPHEFGSEQTPPDFNTKWW